MPELLGIMAHMPTDDTPLPAEKLSTLLKTLQSIEHRMATGGTPTAEEMQGIDNDRAALDKYILTMAFMHKLTDALPDFNYFDHMADQIFAKIEKLLSTHEQAFSAEQLQDMREAIRLHKGKHLEFEKIKRMGTRQ